VCKGDKCVREAAPVLKSGRKWSAKKSVLESEAAIQIGDIVGQVQHGRGGFELRLAPPKWHKAGPVQRRKLVVNEVRKQEERMRCIKAISQATQGEWMKWECVKQPLGRRGSLLSFVFITCYIKAHFDRM